MSHHSEHHHFLEHRLLNSPMSKIYIFQAFMMFTKGMFGVFSPLYLYGLEYTIAQILTLTLWLSVVFLAVTPLCISLMKKLGFKYSLLVSLPLFIVLPISLNFAEVSWFFPFIGYTFLGMHAALYWPAFHSEVAFSGNNKKRGSQIGTLQIITAVIATFAPVVAGTFLQFFNYTSLFIFSIIVMFIGIVPLLASKDLPIKRHHFSFSDYKRHFKSKKHSQSKKAFAAQGIETVLFMYGWSIVLFIILEQDFFIIGTLMTLVSIVSILIVGFFKERIDYQNKNEFLQFSVKLFSFGWVLRSVVLLTGGLFVYITESLSRIFVDLLKLPFATIFYNNARKTNYIDYITLRELCIHGAKILLLIPLITLMYFFDENFLLFLAITLLGSLSAIWMGYLKEE